MSIDTRWRCKVCNELLNTMSNMNTGEITSWLHARRRDHDPIPVPDMESTTPAVLSCDFCGDRVLQPPWWRHPCVATNHDGANGEFVTAQVMMASERDVQFQTFLEDDPDFLACDICHKMIEDLDVTALAVRSVQAYLGAHPEERDIERVIESVAYVQSRFWATRHGESVQENV